MINLIKYSIVKVSKFLNFLKLFYEALKEKKRKENYRPSIVQTSKFDNVLIIVPHADDELIGCYKIIRKKGIQVRIFYCNFTGSDNNDANRNNRLKEFKNSCELLGIKNYKISFYFERDLESEIKERTPDLIMIPSFIDWHYEHRAVNFILLKILNKLSQPIKIGLYQISVPIPKDLINYFATLTKKQQKDKWQIFKMIYKTQTHMPIYRFKLIEKINGKYFNKYAVELYSIMDFNVWANWIASINTPQVLKELDTLKNELHSIDGLYTKPDSILQKIK